MIEVLVHQDEGFSREGVEKNETDHLYIDVNGTRKLCQIVVRLLQAMGAKNRGMVALVFGTKRPCDSWKTFIVLG